MKEVVVTGSRNFQDWQLVFWSMSNEVPMSADPVKFIIGDCPTGADLFAFQWCYANYYSGPNITFEMFEADWLTYGKAAGPMRNRRMCNSVLDRPHAVCLAFPDDQSKGTKDCATYATHCDIEVNFPQLKHNADPMPGSWQEWAVELTRRNHNGNS